MSHVLLRRLRAPVAPAPMLVLGSVVCIQVSQAFGKQMFAFIGPMGVASLRLTIAAAILLLWWRPSLSMDRQSWFLIMAFGTTIAGMNLIYPALVYLPLGMATSLQLLGPLVVALVGSLRIRDFLWSGLAIAGVALFYLPNNVVFSLPGLLFALASAISMGAYLLLSRRAGARSHDGSMLALAVAWAALLTLPFGINESGAELLNPKLLAAGLGLAILSAVIPYSLDQAALRRIPPRLVGILESLEPVAGALAGLLILSESLALPQWIAVACITLASAGAVAFQGHRDNGFAQQNAKQAES